jgi:hypothetical protein
MSYRKKYHQVNIGKDKLLNLFLSQGELLLSLYEEKKITIFEFSDQHVLHEVNGVNVYQAKVHGRSEDPNLYDVHGKVTITPIQNGEVFECVLELKLEDHWE